jgi:hypothetical protein
VRRRWLERPAPNLKRHFHDGAEEAAAEGALEGALNSVADNPLAAIVGGLILFALLIVLLPLLGVALEVVALVFVLCSGLVGRLLLGKPWWVEAAPLGGDIEQRGVYAVKGWRASRQAVPELATAIQATGVPPQRLARGRRLATRPAGAAAADEPGT